MNGTGAGVNVTNVDRVVDEFLIREIRDQQAIIGNLDVREEFKPPKHSLPRRIIIAALRMPWGGDLEAFSVTPSHRRSL